MNGVHWSLLYFILKEKTSFTPLTPLTLDEIRSLMLHTLTSNCTLLKEGEEQQVEELDGNAIFITYLQAGPHIFIKKTSCVQSQCYMGLPPFPIESYFA